MPSNLYLRVADASIHDQADARFVYARGVEAQESLQTFAGCDHIHHRASSRGRMVAGIDEALYGVRHNSIARRPK